MSDSVNLNRDYVLDALHDVIDPELGYNIVDLGLIYGLDIVDGRVKVTMTMTTPGCPAQDYIVMGVQDRTRAISGVKDIDITLVWQPAWSPQKMTAVARQHFGVPENTNE